ncbi:hypothetical protein WJX81_000926 [Elliptochloris bilobata]|uniref:DUF1308 domain-containing protein n=1 Tax=Elliptochloris bilobata TaxID=381761 RepID=A0AAW1SL40_9CHLO
MVEIDVVAARGSIWVEVKAVQFFSGGSGRATGARGPCLHVVFYSTHARWAPEVAARLRQQGVLAAGPGPLDPEILSSLPPPPTIANLDITAMCSLVSGLSHGAKHAPAASDLAPVQKRWFKRCAEEERAAPLLRELHAPLDGKDLVAAEEAATHFDGLVAMYGSERGYVRWAALRARLRI